MKTQLIAISTRYSSSSHVLDMARRVVAPSLDGAMVDALVTHDPNASMWLAAYLVRRAA